MTGWFNHVPGRRAHRRVRRAPVAPADARAGAPPGAARSWRRRALSRGGGRAPSAALEDRLLLGHERATAARWSAVAPVRVIIELSNASASSKVWPAAYATERRIAPSATVGPAASRAASSRDRRLELVGRDDLRGQAERERPRRPRWCAGSRAARSPWPGRPAAAGVSWTPVSQDSATLAKARLKPAVSATIRRSQANARLAPAPAATPLTAAITGLAMPASAGDDRVVVLVDGAEQLRRCEPLWRISMCSLRSWPTQKARPVPVSTTQRAAGSSATCAHGVEQQPPWSRRRGCSSRRGG